MSDIKSRIRKLLAMAESTSEHEAKTALLKARALMAEAKLTQADLDDVRNDKIGRRDTEHTASKTKNFWMTALAATIGERYCCKPVMKYKTGGRLYHMGFVGFESDLDVCVEVYNYAVGYVKGQIRLMEKELRSRNYTGVEIRKIANGYGYGFTAGLEDAYKTQDEKQKEYGLVLVTPKEVSDALRGVAEMSSAPSENSTRYSRYAEGYENGKNFTANGLKEARQSARQIA